MFQTEGREIGMIPGSVSEAGLQKQGRTLERCPAGTWRHTYRLHQPQEASPEPIVEFTMRKRAYKRDQG